MMGNKIKKWLLSGVALLLGTALPFASWADEPKVYQVELILFSHLTPEALNAEHWPVQSKSAVNLEKAVTLKSMDEARGTHHGAQPFFALLPHTSFTMQREEKALERDSSYAVLLHIAWRQPITNRRHATPIHIYGGASYDNEGNVLTLNTSEREPYDTQPHWQVDGTFNISVLRYLTAAFDLQFAAPRSEIVSLSNTNNFADISSGLLYFTLKQNRRMRSKELNYIDYPLYGALIKVTPIS